MNMDASQNNFNFTLILFNLFSKKKKGKIFFKKGGYTKKYMYIHTYIYRRRFFIFGKKNSANSKEYNFLFKQGNEDIFKEK